MSVLIKMDMPKSCDVCDFMRINDDLMSTDYRFMFCGFPGMGKFVTYYTDCRPSDCPLSEVPAHGRLIDADLLLKSEADYEHPLFDTDGSWDCVVPCYDRETIKSAPTVIEAEE